METKIPVKEVMTTGVISSSEDDSAQDVAHKMKDEGVSSVIVTSNDETVGILTEKDLVHKVLARDLPVDRVKVEEIMTSPVETVDPEVELNEAARMMREGQVKRFPVVDGDELVGIITQTDLMAVAPEISDILQENLANYKPAGQAGEWASGICDVCGSYVEDLQDQDGQLICQSCLAEYGG